MRKNNVYITFPKGESTNGWMNNFTHSFITTLNRVLDNDHEIYVKELDFSDENYSEFLRKSGIYVLVLGTKMDGEEAYITEVGEILNHASDERRNLFVVYQMPPERNFIKTVADAVQTYNFFVAKGRNFSKSEPLSFKADRDIIWSKLLDMAYDIKAELYPTKENSKVVYLGNCSWELHLNRDEIRREIQRMGYRVVPGRNLPTDKDEVAEMVASGLQKSCFVVQVMGSRYGNISPGGKMSNFEMENREIFSGIKKNPGLKRLVWIPADMKISDSKQQLYISRIKRDEATVNTMIVETNIEEFKTLLGHQLSTKGKAKARQKPEGVYYIACNGNRKGVLEMGKKAKVEVICRDYSEEGGGYQKHLDNISKSQAVLIDCDLSNKQWLSSMVKDIVKAIGLGRNVPFKAIGIISVKTAEIPEAANWLPGPQFIEPGNRDMLTDFFNRIKA